MQHSALCGSFDAQELIPVAASLFLGGSMLACEKGAASLGCLGFLWWLALSLLTVGRAEKVP